MNKEGTQIKSPVLYLQHHYELLKLEYEYEKEQFQQQTELMGIGRKIKRGMCWYPLSLGRSYYNALNQLVIEVERKEDKEIEHLWETGLFLYAGYVGETDLPEFRSYGELRGGRPHGSHLAGCQCTAYAAE